MVQHGDGEAHAAGIEAYLTKPVRQGELRAALALVMGRTPEEASDEDHEVHLVTRHDVHEVTAQHKPHALLAEDNPVNQKVSVGMLEKLGYRVDVAADGLQVLEALSRQEYSAILMDVQMSNMDGHEVTRQVREREGSTRHIPIIAMTAGALHGEREAALQAGMDDYISKPVKSENLDVTLKRWISETDTPEALVDRASASSPSHNVSPPLDQAAIDNLRDLVDGEGEVLAKLVEMFLEEAPSHIAGLRAVMEQGDADSIERIAHTLKGSSGNMGASRMAEISADLQSAGVTEDLSRAPELVDQLQEEFDRVRLALIAETPKILD